VMLGGGEFLSELFFAGFWGLSLEMASWVRVRRYLTITGCQVGEFLRISRREVSAWR